jgi:hypothetical protein
LVAKYETSGLSRIEFCAKHELSLSTFSRHRKLLAIMQQRSFLNTESAVF